MADLGGFDADQVEPSKSFDPILPGKYLAVIVKSEMKANKARTGYYLELTFLIIDGDFKNRLLWVRLNLQNPNTKAVEIARADLSAICRAVGVPKPNDSTDLHDLPLVIHVTRKKQKDTGEIVNEIQGYLPKDQAAPAANAASVDSALPADTMPPWKRSG